MPHETHRNDQLTGRLQVRCTADQEAKVKALADLLDYDSYADLIRDRFVEPACQQHDTIVEKVGSKHAA